MAILHLVWTMQAMHYGVLKAAYACTQHISLHFHNTNTLRQFQPGDNGVLA